jgi:hypothetical protein
MQKYIIFERERAETSNIMQIYIRFAENFENGTNLM